MIEQRDDLMENDLIIIESFGKLEVKKGDVVIVKHPGHISKKSIDYISKIVIDCFKPMDVKVVVLEEGMDIGILRYSEVI